jgi:hypothetical protein
MARTLGQGCKLPETDKTWGTSASSFAQNKAKRFIRRAYSTKFERFIPCAVRSVQDHLGSQILRRAAKRGRDAFPALFVIFSF